MEYIKLGLILLVAYGFGVVIGILPSAPIDFLISIAQEILVR